MRKKSKIIAIVILAVLLVLPAAYAQMPDVGGKGYQAHKADMMGKLTGKLGLTAEQQEELKRIGSEFKAKKQRIHKATKEKNVELHEALSTAESDVTAINSIAAEVKSLMAQNVDLRISHVLKMKEFLTPEQFEQLKTLKQEHKQKRFQHKEGRRRKFFDRSAEELEESHGIGF